MNCTRIVTPRKRQLDLAASTSNWNLLEWQRQPAPVTALGRLSVSWNAVRETVLIPSTSISKLPRYLIIYQSLVKTCTEVEITRSGDIAKEMVEIVYQDIPLERPEGWRYPLYSKISFSCKDSTWQLVGPKSIFCLEDGLWSDKAASECGEFWTRINCMMLPETNFTIRLITVKTCGAPPVKNDGNSSNNAALESLFNPPAIDEQEQRYAVKTIVEFQCNQKIYQLNGSRTLECLPNGEWNATRPTCGMELAIVYRSLHNHNYGIHSPEL